MRAIQNKLRDIQQKREEIMKTVSKRTTANAPQQARTATDSAMGSNLALVSDSCVGEPTAREKKLLLELDATEHECEQLLKQTTQRFNALQPNGEIHAEKLNMLQTQLFLFLLTVILLEEMLRNVAQTRMIRLRFTIIREAEAMFPPIPCAVKFHFIEVYCGLLFGVPTPSTRIIAQYSSVDIDPKFFADVECAACNYQALKVHIDKFQKAHENKFLQYTPQDTTIQYKARCLYVSPSTKILHPPIQTHVMPGPVQAGAAE